jgi:thiamine biosynthesis protein ThiI
MTSPQIEREVGGLIKQAKGWRVDLSHPALTIHIEMLPEQAFYFFGKEPGAGGLPTGSGGRVACLLSGGIDSPVAAFRMMRRGCVGSCSLPQLSDSLARVRESPRIATLWRGLSSRRA